MVRGSQLDTVALRIGERGELLCWGFRPNGRLRHPVFLNWMPTGSRVHPGAPALEVVAVAFVHHESVYRPYAIVSQADLADGVKKVAALPSRTVIVGSWRARLGLSD